MRRYILVEHSRKVDTTAPPPLVLPRVNVHSWEMKNLGLAATHLRKSICGDRNNNLFKVSCATAAKLVLTLACSTRLAAFLSSTSMLLDTFSHSHKHRTRLIERVRDPFQRTRAPLMAIQIEDKRWWESVPERDLGHARALFPSVSYDAHVPSFMVRFGIPNHRYGECER